MPTEPLLRLVTDDWVSHRDACQRQIAFFTTSACDGMTNAERTLAISALHDVVDAYDRLLINHERRQAALRAMAQDTALRMPYPGPPPLMNDRAARFTTAIRPE